MMRKRKSGSKPRRQGGGKAGFSTQNRQPVAAAVSRKPSPHAGEFPVVGLGASAGGLEALEEFFSQVPPQNGMAFVVVTHQHPGHTSLLPELLRKHTRMTVVEAEDGQRVRPNCVYLSRAERRLGIFNGVLQLVKIKGPQNDHLPIDYFFRSLAEDQGERAIGIVLSGTGTDGTSGIKAIKEAKGMTLAQEGESAKYAGMPGSAIATGLVDYVLPPKQMAGRLLAQAKRSQPWQGDESSEADESGLPERFQKIIHVLRSRTGHDFSAYKTATISRRVERRMNLHQIKSLPHYLGYLQENLHEADLLFNELLIGVTGFFRDPEAFKALAKKALPELLKAKPDGSTMRVWVPGCSTGEEAYTLAMTLQDGVERLQKRIAIQVFATDLDSRAIDFARNGVYPDGVVSGMPREHLARHFTREGRSYRVKKTVRELVVFAQQNVIKDPPFTKLDLVSCRNLLIYLKADVQKRLLGLFHYALKPHGLLFLGPSENLGDLSRHFSVADKKGRIFIRKETLPMVNPALEFQAGSAQPALPPAVPALPPGPGPEPRGAVLFERLLASRFVPASVIVNPQGDISYIYGRTGDYLEPASGQPRLNLLEMAREGLRLELSAAIHRAATHDGEVVREAVRVRMNGGFANVKITVTRIEEPESVRGLLLVTFQHAISRPQPAVKTEGAQSKKQTNRLRELEQELQFARESLQSTVEELQSSNEELQSTNEELQSSNEELETSREEMQSLNEELQTVNAQLQGKVDALSQTNDDMQNLLNSTSVATIFLDSYLKIKRFTDQARTVINLIPSDVGRPIGDLVSKLNYEGFEADAAEVLRTLNFKQREVQAKQGDWRLVRILPYRTMENVIDGLVITFVDINRLKKAEQAAQQARMLAEGIVTTLREPVLVLDTKLRVVSANRSFYRQFRVAKAEVEHRLVYELGDGQWNIPRLRRLLEQILPKNSSFEDFEVAHDFPRVGHRVLLLNARRLQQENDSDGLILLAMEDVTDKRPQKIRRRAK